MPNAPVPAAATGLPAETQNLSRRLFLACGSAAAVFGTLASARAAESDADLVALVDELARARSIYESLNEVEERLLAVVYDRKPARPEALLFRGADCLCDLGVGVPPAFKGERFYTVDLVDQLRAHPPIHPRDQKRAAEIVAAHDDYAARYANLQAEVGYTEARDRADEAYDRVFTLEQQVITMPAKTLSGVLVKARLVSAYREAGIEDDPDLERADRLQLSIVRDLLTARLTMEV